MISRDDGALDELRPLVLALVAGFAFAAPTPASPDWPGEALELEDLAVAAEVRGAGVGQRLLAAVRDHAGDREIRLMVPDVNAGARRFYAREGFVERAREFVLATNLAVQVLDDLVMRALAEDLGAGDVTTAATVPAGARARARITQKAPGVIFGLDAAEAVLRGAGPCRRDPARDRGGGRWRERRPGAVWLAGEARRAALRRAHRAQLPAAPLAAWPR